MNGQTIPQFSQHFMFEKYKKKTEGILLFKWFFVIMMSAQEKFL